MLSLLEKQWICATCAPESIHRIKEIGTSTLYFIHNEDNTIHIWVLCSDVRILGIGRTADELKHSTPCSIEDGVTKIGELLNLSGVRLTKP